MKSEGPKPIDLIKIKPISLPGVVPVKRGTTYIQLYDMAMTFDLRGTYNVDCIDQNSQPGVVDIDIDTRCTVGRYVIEDISRYYDEETRSYGVSVDNRLRVNVSTPQEADEIYDKLVMWRFGI